MIFHYRAYASDGKEIAGSLEAEDESAALRNLEQQGLVPIHLGLKEQDLKPWYLRDIQFVRSGFGDTELANIARQLSALFQSGMNANEVLQIAKLSQSKKALNQAFSEVETRVSEGLALSDAFGYPGSPFAREFIGFLRIGDAANNNAAALKSAATFFASRATTKDKVTSALVYPVILVLVGVGLLLMLAFFLVPTLLPLFRSAGTPPPVFFVLMDQTARFLALYWAVVAIAGIGFFLLFAVWRSTETGKRSLQELLYRLPKLGPLGFRTQIAVLSRSIGLLSKSGFTLPDSFLQVAQTTQNNYLANCFEMASANLKTGQSALDSLKDHKRLPKDFLAIVDLAERTNQWNEALTGYADALDQRNEETRNRILALVTPIITIVIGLLAGSLIYTVMSALLEINAIATP